MNDNWIEEKAREWMLKCRNVLGSEDHNRQVIAAALREAENRGLEKAAELCERQVWEAGDHPSKLFSQAADAIRALKTGEEMSEHEGKRALVCEHMREAGRVTAHLFTCDPVEVEHEDGGFENVAHAVVCEACFQACEGDINRLDFDGTACLGDLVPHAETLH